MSAEGFTIGKKTGTMSAQRRFEECVSGHGLEIAAELCRHDSSRCRCGSYDARKKAFGKYEGVSRRAQSHNQPDDNADYYELLNTYPRVPACWTHTTEVHLAERDKQDEEHEHGEKRVEYGVEETRSPVELWHEGKGKIEDAAHSHRYGQRKGLEKRQAYGGEGFTVQCSRRKLQGTRGAGRRSRQCCSPYGARRASGLRCSIPCH